MGLDSSNQGGHEYEICIASYTDKEYMEITLQQKH